MNFLRRCVPSTATLPPPLSLSSRTYSTHRWSVEHSSSSIRSPELNEQAKQPIAADSSRPSEIPYQVKLKELPVNFADDKSKGLNFKHTENSASLWLRRAPEWFVERIESLDSDSYCSKEEMWKSLAENPDQWWDNRADKISKESPDFTHKKTGVKLWIVYKREWSVTMDNRKLKLTPKYTKLDSWMSLAEDPSQWWDNRAIMKPEKTPDFKHKKTKVELWLENKPDWFVAKDLKDTKENAWKSLAKYPNRWWDNRATKKSEKPPDFRHKKNKVALWLVDKPDWFVPKYNWKLKDKKEDAWKRLLKDPSQWWDNRLKKNSVKYPDFKHKDSGEALSLSCAPDWVVVSKLPPLNR